MKTTRRIPRKEELQARVNTLKAAGKAWKEITETVNAEGFVDASGKPWVFELLRTNYHRWPKPVPATAVSDSSDISEAMPATAPESDLTDTKSGTSEVSEASEAATTPELEPLSVEEHIQSDTSEVTDAIEELPVSDTSDTSDSTEHPVSDVSVISDETPMPEAWQGQIRQIVQKELEAMTPEPQFTKEDIVQIVQKELTSMKEAIQTDQTFLTEKTPTMEPAPMPGERIKGEKGKPINPGKRVKVAGTVDEVLEQRIRQWCRENRTTLSYALDAALWHFFGKPKLSFEMSEVSEATPNTEE